MFLQPKSSLVGFLLLLFLLSGIRQMNAQNCSQRYLTQEFEPQSALNVVYGNAPELTAVYISEEVTVDVDLEMDIYSPMGDTQQLRPCVVLAYGGAWIFGSKEDEDISSTCDSLARKGYVAVSMNYRMGLNLTNVESVERAVYRSAQDFSAAIRFLKEHAEDYGIDPDYIFAGGVSAGGFAALHMAYLDEDERPESTYTGGLFDTWPDLLCMDCEGNQFDQSHDVRGIINLWGAILDVEFMDSEQMIPQVAFHGTDDEIVPYDTGSPFGATLVAPNVDGSLPMHLQLEDAGVSSELNTFLGVGHNIWGVNVLNELTPGPTEHWQPITDSIGSWLYEQIRPSAPIVDLPAQPFGLVPVELSVQNTPLDGFVCWNIEGGQILTESADGSTIEVLWDAVGTYTVSATNLNHLNAESHPSSWTIEVDQIDGIIGVENASSADNYTILSLNGAVVASGLRNLEEVNANLTGVYIVQSFARDGSLISSKKYHF